MCFICLGWLNLFRKKERKKTMEKTLRRHCSFAPPRPSPPLAHSSRLMWTTLLEHVKKKKKKKSEVQFKNGVNQLYVPPWLKCEGYMRKGINENNHIHIQGEHWCPIKEKKMMYCCQLCCFPSTWRSARCCSVTLTLSFLGDKTNVVHMCSKVSKLSPDYKHNLFKC